MQIAISSVCIVDKCELEPYPDSSEYTLQCHPVAGCTSQDQIQMKMVYCVVVYRHAHNRKRDKGITPRPQRPFAGPIKVSDKTKHKESRNAL